MSAPTASAIVPKKHSTALHSDAITLKPGVKKGFWRLPPAMPQKPFEAPVEACDEPSVKHLHMVQFPRMTPNDSNTIRMVVLLQSKAPMFLELIAKNAKFQSLDSMLNVSVFVLTDEIMKNLPLTTFDPMIFESHIGTRGGGVETENAMLLSGNVAVVDAQVGTVEIRNPLSYETIQAEAKIVRNETKIFPNGLNLYILESPLLRGIVPTTTEAEDAPKPVTKAPYFEAALSASASADPAVFDNEVESTTPSSPHDALDNLKPNHRATLLCTKKILRSHGCEFFVDAIETHGVLGGSKITKLEITNLALPRTVFAPMDMSAVEDEHMSAVLGCHMLREGVCIDFDKAKQHLANGGDPIVLGTSLYGDNLVITGLDADQNLMLNYESRILKEHSRGIGTAAGVVYLLDRALVPMCLK
jgi:hypothetical protein